MCNQPDNLKIDILENEKFHDKEKVRKQFDFQGKSVIVAGAPGVIGSHPCNRLLNMDAECTV